jgi:hypothetical protein
MLPEQTRKILVVPKTRHQVRTARRLNISASGHCQASVGYGRNKQAKNNFASHGFATFFESLDNQP